MAISDTSISAIVASVSESPALEQREVMDALPDGATGVMDFTIWGDGKRVAEFRIPRGLWAQFKAFGDEALARFDGASAS